MRLRIVTKPFQTKDKYHTEDLCIEGWCWGSMGASLLTERCVSKMTQPQCFIAKGHHHLQSKHLKNSLGPTFVPVLAKGGPYWHPIHPDFGSGGGLLAPRLSRFWLRGGPVGTPFAPVLAQAFRCLDYLKDIL